MAKTNLRAAEKIPSAASSKAGLRYFNSYSSRFGRFAASFVFAFAFSFISLSYGQEINHAEYFLDSDPGYGNGTEVEVQQGAEVDLHFDVSSSDLSEGFHVLSMRVKDTFGSWSLTHRSPFFVVKSSVGNVANVEAIEYFVGDDPGFGQGTPVPVTAATEIDRTFLVNLVGLANGSHILSVRVRDSNGQWSLTHQQVFFATLPTVAVPIIFTQPVSQTVNPGESATFQFSADGTQPLTYAWEQNVNGTFTQVATTTVPELTIADAQVSNGGDYRVKVSNTAGSTLTDVFAFTVTAPPSSFHTADYRDPRWIISGTEANRVLSYWRAGGYHADSTGLDGYAPAVGETTGSFHAADYRDPKWIMSGTEANRVLSYWRAGGYHVDSTGLDGYAPGAPVGLSSFRSGPVRPSVQVRQYQVQGANVSGDSVQVNLEVQYTGFPLGLLVRPKLPTGWEVSRVAGDGEPESAHGDLLWTRDLPPSPIQVSYTVKAPSGAIGENVIQSSVEVQFEGLVNPNESVATTSLLVRETGDGELGGNDRVHVTADGRVLLRFAVEPESHYVVERSGDLVQWNELARIHSTTSTVDLIDPESGNTGVRFYRLRSMED